MRRVFLLPYFIHSSFRRVSRKGSFFSIPPLSASVSAGGPQHSCLGCLYGRVTGEGRRVCIKLVGQQAYLNSHSAFLKLAHTRLRVSCSSVLTVGHRPRCTRLWTVQAPESTDFIQVGSWLCHLLTCNLKQVTEPLRAFSSPLSSWT